MKHILQQYKRFPLSTLTLEDETTCITLYRPFLVQFLLDLKLYFDFIVLFSLGENEYVLKIADYIQNLLGDSTYFDLILTHEDCLRSLKKCDLYKSMDYVKEQINKKFNISYYDLTVSLMIDDNPIHKIANQETTFFQCSPFHPGQNLSSTWRYQAEVAHHWILADQELQTIHRFINSTFPPLNQTP